MAEMNMVQFHSFEDEDTEPPLPPDEFLRLMRDRLAGEALPDFPMLPSAALAIPFGAITKDGVLTEEDRHRFADYESDCCLNEKFNHVFAGTQLAPVAWCPNCHLPLTQFAALDTSDTRLHLGGWDRELRLLFCWRCPVSGTGVHLSLGETGENWHTESGRITFLRGLDGEISVSGGAPFYYQVRSDNTVNLLQYNQGPPTPNHPYADYPESFPEARLPLFRLTDDVQTALRWYDLDTEGDELEDTTALHAIIGNAEWHQIGGNARLYSGKHYSMLCPLCSERMPFFACIWDECTDPRGFVGDCSPQVIYHICVKCFVLGAYEVTD